MSSTCFKAAIPLGDPSNCSSTIILCKMILVFITLEMSLRSITFHTCWILWTQRTKTPKVSSISFFNYFCAVKRFLLLFNDWFSDFIHKNYPIETDAIGGTVKRTALVLIDFQFHEWWELTFVDSRYLSSPLTCLELQSFWMYMPIQCSTLAIASNVMVDCFSLPSLRQS